jgi:hypothetical protein
MKARPRYLRLAGRAMVPALFLLFLSCGGVGIGSLAGGGTGGTGITTGAISGFGSVVVNGTHYLTDNAVAPGFVTRKIARGVDHSKAKDRDLFGLGMVVTVHHAPDDNNAVEIEYEPHLTGPIAYKTAGAEPSLEVLGQPVIVDNNALFASLEPGNVVEISGYVDDEGRIRATFLQIAETAPSERDSFDLKGFVSEVRPAEGTFRLGPLPGGRGNTVSVAYSDNAIGSLAGPPADGRYVQVTTTDVEPVNGVITAAAVLASHARTDFPDGASVDLEALVTGSGGVAGDTFSFEAEGVPVLVDESTVFAGGAAADVRNNARVRIRGTASGGVISASRVDFP